MGRLGLGIGLPAARSTPAGDPPALLPPDILGPLLDRWIRGDRGLQVDGEGAFDWAASDGTSFVQATPLQKPQVTAGLDGIPGIVGDALDDHMTNSVPLVYPGAFSCFYVHKPTATNDRFAIGGANGAGWRSKTAGANQWFVDPSTFVANVGDRGTRTGLWTVYYHARDGADGVVLRGTQGITEGAAAGVSGTMTFDELLATGGNLHNTDSEVLEVIWCNAPLDAPTYDAMKAYFLSTYPSLDPFAS